MTFVLLQGTSGFASGEVPPNPINPDPRGPQLKSPALLLKQSEGRLNAALQDYEAPPSSTLSHKFYELKLQAAIFNYDISYDMMSLWQAAPEGFAEKVALKSLVHRLYEYDRLMRERLLPRLLQLAKDREIQIDRNELKNSRKEWKEQFNRLRGWREVRNKATAHYDDDLKEQVSLLQSLQRNEVEEVVQAFLSYNIRVINILKNAGRGCSETSPSFQRIGLADL